DRGNDQGLKAWPRGLRPLRCSFSRGCGIRMTRGNLDNSKTDSAQRAVVAHATAEHKERRPYCRLSLNPRLGLKLGSRLFPFFSDLGFRIYGTVRFASRRQTPEVPNCNDVCEQ